MEEKFKSYKHLQSGQLHFFDLILYANDIPCHSEKELPQEVLDLTLSGREEVKFTIFRPEYGLRSTAKILSVGKLYSRNLN